MRYLVLALILVAGPAVLGVACDLPPGPAPNVTLPTDSPSTTTQTGTVIGGALLAAALLIGGLWLRHNRKPSSSN
jgi:hypothetical protein